MEDGFPFPYQTGQREEYKKNRGFDFLKFIIFLGLIALTAIVSYFLGSRKTLKESRIPISVEDQSNILTNDQNLANQKNPTASPSGNLSPSPTQRVISTQTPSPTPLPKTSILTSLKTLDGFVSSNQVVVNTVEIRAGRNQNLIARGFLSFDLSDLPQGANILEATLRIYQAQIIGNPYSSGNSLEVDHLNYGDSLDPTDYGTPSLVSSFATISKNSKLEWKEADVTNQIKDDLRNAKSLSQFRIHFSKEARGGDIDGDFAYFESADNTLGTGNIPQLVVRYY